MTIHAKINARQARVIQHYLDSLFRSSLPTWEIRNYLRIPKYLCYGGYRNTRYHDHM